VCAQSSARCVTIDYPHGSLLPVWFTDELATASLQGRERVGNHVTMAAQHRSIWLTDEQLQHGCEGLAFAQTFVADDLDIELDGERFEGLATSQKWARQQCAAGAGVSQWFDQGVCLSPSSLTEWAL
jgi:hypothetical protein